MTSAELLVDAFGRIRQAVAESLTDLAQDQLGYRADPRANSIAWLVWHLTRIQDDHLADVIDSEQVWTAAGWADRFNLPFDRFDTGYGHGPSEVAVLAGASGQVLLGYHDAVYRRTIDYVGGITDADLDRTVDKAYDPPVTLGVRLVSVITDDLLHAGQANYLKGHALRVG